MVPLPKRGVPIRNGTDQLTCVGMFGVVDHLGRRSDLDDLPVLHDPGDVVAQLPDHSEVVADEENCVGLEVPLDAHQQIQHGPRTETSERRSDLVSDTPGFRRPAPVRSRRVGVDPPQLHGQIAGTGRVEPTIARSAATSPRR